MDIISRKEWGARSPKETPVTTTWAKRTGFAVHYSGANKAQTIRSIQDYCMDTRGFNDIDYNFLVTVDGRIWEGRGWMVVGSHIANANTPNLGVCMVGTNADVTDAAKRSIRWLYDEANRRAGKTLAKRYHSMLASTSCPGDNLRKWVDAGMPVGSPAPTTPTTDWSDALMAKLATIKEGSKGNLVRRMQALVESFGIDLGKVDGDFGPNTDRAVRAFQRKFSLAVDGICGPKTWAALLTH